ncbi:hypothetical protein GF367_02550 [Candidatus Woesearchaeota archaeon]|nr:hypothetical protein [Candidatus Woesearchaeota archaeon]
MVLSGQVAKKIEDFVRAQPRTVQDIALLLGKNWRTADGYVRKIAAEQGTIATKTFRGGTRGALKVVYWNVAEKFHTSAFQERLFSKILSGREKNDFNPFDIYQYVSEGKRRAFLEKQTIYNITEKQNLVNALRQAEQQVLIFAGDLSWSVAKQGNITLLSLLEELVARKIPIKIICNVDLESIDNIQSVISLNHKHKTEVVEVRHAQQPLRAFVVDDSFARFKQRKQKRRQDDYVFYEVLDEEWVQWVQQVFWHLFRTGISAGRRIKDLESIERIR